MSNQKKQMQKENAPDYVSPNYSFTGGCRCPACGKEMDAAVYYVAELAGQSTWRDNSWQMGGKKKSSQNTEMFGPMSAEFASIASRRAAESKSSSKRYSHLCCWPWLSCLQPTFPTMDLTPLFVRLSDPIALSGCLCSPRIYCAYTISTGIQTTASAATRSPLFMSMPMRIAKTGPVNPTKS